MGSAPGPKPVPRETRQAFDPVAYFDRLDPAHVSLGSLELDLATYEAFMAGHCSVGGNRGRLAIAVHDMDGQVLYFCGRAIGDGSPTLVFPNGADSSVIFNAHRVGAGELYLVRDPLVS